MKLALLFVWCQEWEGPLGQQYIENATLDRERCVSILVVDDSELSRDAALVLCEENFRDFNQDDVSIKQASNIKDALELIASTSFHVILLDRDLGNDGDGRPVDSINYIAEVKALQPLAEILVLTSNETPSDIARAMSVGASNYLLKSSSEENINYKNSVIRTTLSHAVLKLRQARSEKSPKESQINYVCKSSAMKHHNFKLEALGESNRPVTILGASGLGKGVSARMLNQYRAKYLGVTSRPFFNLNIAAMTDELAQSELFGHEANSFTGAGNKTKIGYFELANGGDLFLDEIGDASIELQTKLLKVIEEREYQRIGGSKTLKTTARVIFATNKDLKELVRQGKFKDDLYARISTFIIEVPTLEDRAEDLPHLVRSLIARANKETNSRQIDPNEVPDDLMEYLCRPNIPGNVRGIENDIQRLLLFSRKQKNGLVDLSNWRNTLGVLTSSARGKHTISEAVTIEDLKSGNTNFIQEGFPGLKEFKELVEAACIREAKKKIQSSRERARILGLDKATMYRKSSKYKT